MLDVLENNHNKDEKGLTPEELEAQSLLLFLAGYETTTSTLAFLAYCLAINPECQKKLVNEIDETFEHSVSMKGTKNIEQTLDTCKCSHCNGCFSAQFQSEVSMDKLSEMSYLDMCLSETLRMYPPVIRCNISYNYLIFSI